METPPKKLFIFQEKTFGGQKLKIFLYFGKKNFLASKLKTLCFRRNLQSQEIKSFLHFPLETSKIFQIKILSYYYNEVFSLIL